MYKTGQIITASSVVEATKIVMELQKEGLSYKIYYYNNDHKFRIYIRRY